MSQELTQARLKEVLHYAPATGRFTWRVARSNVKAGSTAGCLHRHGYTVIGLDGYNYHAHRLAFLYMIGEWPKQGIDHCNRVRDDNRWHNLRDVSPQANCHNIGMNRRNTSGFAGVCWYAARGKWRASIRVDGKKKHLGDFATAEAAHQAYLAAKAALHVPVPAANDQAFAQVANG